MDEHALRASAEIAQRLNREKTALVREFPGLCIRWDACIGRTVTDVVTLDERHTLLCFDDGRFVLTGEPSLDPVLVQRAIEHLRSQLAGTQPEALARYDALREANRETARLARGGKILDAIEANVVLVPELLDALPGLIERLRREGPSCRVDGDET